MTDRPQLIINGFAQPTPSHHLMGLWRSPWGRDQNMNDLQTWVDMAKTLEDARFDGLFLADSLGVMGQHGGDHRYHVEQGLAFPANDAIIVAAALMGATEHLHLGFTSSMIQNQPFELARLISTMDHMSKGRIGWNIVTSGLDNAYRNLGFEGMLPHGERYSRIDEFMEVVYGLWEGSWDDDALKRDWENGIYADPQKVHRINHVGKNYRVEGPHLSEPSPQKTPFLYTAGMSTSSLRMAAKHAEGLLIQARDPQHAGEITRQVRSYLAEFGRHESDLKVFQLLKVVVGSTEEEARRNYEEINEWIHPLASIVERSAILGTDLGLSDPDEPIDIDNAPGFAGVYGAAALEPGQKTTTVRELVERTAVKPFVGTPEQIASLLEEYQDAGIEGINIADYMFHKSFKDFAEQVMPVLRERGLARREYATGTFRDRVFGDGPHLNSRHPGAGHRGRYDTNMA